MCEGGRLDEGAHLCLVQLVSPRSARAGLSVTPGFFPLQRAPGMLLKHPVLCNGTNGSHVSHENRSWLHVKVTDRHGFHAKFPLKYRISEGAARGDLPKERSSANGKPSDSLKVQGE